MDNYTFVNLTPHAIDVYSKDQFVNLEQSNPTTWIADSVTGAPTLLLPQPQSIARISVKTVDALISIPGVEMVETQYGEITGLPAEYTETTLFVVSLPTQSNAKAAGHPLANQMVAPYKVVRLRSNTSTILGCMGFTF